MTAKRISNGYLEGQLLIAMPNMQDERFSRSVVYMCAHNADGAMGLVVNRIFDGLSFPDLLQQLGIEGASEVDQIRVHFGGPVESARGFVLHSADYVQESTMVVGGDIGLTATVDILREIARGRGPRHSLLALGYAGWGPGQLEHEIQENGWLNVPPDPQLLFDPDLDSKWNRALGKLGVSISMLSGSAGHA